jgi:hypothetical protein
VIQVVGDSSGRRFIVVMIQKVIVLSFTILVHALQLAQNAVPVTLA